MNDETIELLNTEQTKAIEMEQQALLAADPFDFMIAIYLQKGIESMLPDQNNLII